jgi:F-type H+-transporting ATPase subunit delta
MSDYRVARRYAKSLFELAVEQKILEEVNESITLIRTVCHENRNLVRLLKNPIIRYDHKLRILNRLFEGRIDDMSLRFVQLITKKNREAILPAIAEVFGDIYNQYNNITIAQITTAMPLNDALRSAFQERLEKGEGTVVLQEVVDEDIIGGFVLDIGDRRIDSSIKTMINNLKKELTKET